MVHHWWIAAALLRYLSPSLSLGNAGKPLAAFGRSYLHHSFTLRLECCLGSTSPGVRVIGTTFLIILFLSFPEINSLYLFTLPGC